MKIYTCITLGIVVTTAAMAQSMRATDTVEVSDSVQVRTTLDIDSGRTACKNELAPQCDSQSYSACDYGVEYSYLDASTVAATFTGRQCAVGGICYNYYDCGGTCVGVCNDPPPPTDPILQGCGCSPLILDLGDAGIRMTSAVDGVSFDLNADGWAEHMSWTAAGEGDGFLVFDRNHNGRIDDGGELFGDSTWQPESETPNGFAALRVYDAPYLGGNEDNELSAADAVWPYLRIWIDNSHDGVSQLSEIFTFHHFGILSIGLDPIEARARDRFGNEFRYRSKAALAGHPPITEVVDVFLQEMPE